MADPGTPLCTYAQFTSGAFGDLVAGYDQTTVTDILLEASRICEDETNRRLAPFGPVTETHRAEGIDPDEYAGDVANLPVDIRSTLGASYAQSIGATDLVRHCWVDESAPRYIDLWQYSGVSVTIVRSYGGTQQVAPAQILSGPDPDTGHLWFQLGIFLPVGSRIKVTYSGGYTVAIPASLVRANKYLAAEIVIRELDPGTTNHNPDQLHKDAMTILNRWSRGNSEAKGS